MSTLDPRALDDMAALLWRTEAEDVGAPPSVPARRTREAFDEQSDAVKDNWRKFARAALSQPEAGEPMEPLGADFAAVWDKNVATLHECDPVAPQPALAVKGVTDAMVEAATRELLAHGEFSSIRGNNEPNARIAARAVLALVASPPPSGEVIERCKAKLRAMRKLGDPNDHAIVAAILALSCAPATADGWRTMDSAPKDGAYVLVRLSNGEVFRALWAQTGWLVASDIGFVNPHRWMPLPAAPTATGGR